MRFPTRINLCQRGKNKFAVEKIGIPQVSGAFSRLWLIKPEIGFDMLATIDAMRPHLSNAVRTSVEIAIKYEGYITAPF